MAKRDQRTYSKLLGRYFDAYQWHLKHYPKAAKKRRIKKKWLNRFGEGLTGMLKDMMLYGTGYGMLKMDKKYYALWHSPAIIHLPTGEVLND